MTDSSMSPEANGSSGSGQMPTPASFDPHIAPAGSAGPAGDDPMAVPSMGAAPAGEMPIPSAGEPGSPSAPAGGMPAPGAGARMPEPRSAAASVAGGGAGAAPELSTDDSPLPRFGPPGGPGFGAGSGGGGAFEPGLVEVQFRDGVAPDLAPGGPGAPASIVAANAGPLGELNALLRRNGLVQAEPTFLISHSEATAAQTLAASQGIDAPHLAHFMTLRFPAGADTRAIAAELSALPEVDRAIPVPTVLPPTAVLETPAGTTEAAPEPATAPPGPETEPLLGTSGQVVVNPSTGLENQWYIYRCGVNSAWTRSTGRNVVVADIDWGYRATHQDLTTKITRRYNAVDGTTDVTHGGSVSHGTAVTGIAAGAVNRAGMAGIAYDSEIWAVQGDSGTGTPIGGNPWARGIDWVRTTNSGGRRKVIILEVQTGSFGNIEQVPSVNAAIRTAIAAGVVVCVAAGNGNRDAGVDDSGNVFPETGSILVGATSYHATENRRAGFSNFGPRIVASAPGDPDHDLTANSSSDIAYRNGFGGTSGATPKVAGVAALMLAANPSLSHADIRRILSVTGTAPITESGRAIGRFLNAGPAVRQAAVGTVGRLEIFARGSDKALWHKWQVAPNSGWSGWATQGGWIDILEVGRNADGRMEVFARGSDGAVWHKWQVAPNAGWSAWQSLGGWVDMIAVGSNADGRMEIFARGADKALWHKWQVVPNGGWSGWESLGGWIDDLAVASNADGRMEVFARGADKALWHKWQVVPNGGWSGWNSQGGWIDRIATERNADGRLEVFVRGADAALWHKWQVAPNGNWSGWASQGGWIDMLEASRNLDGRLEVFARGADGALWHKWQVAPNSGWSGWASQGGWIDDLRVAQNNDGRQEVFARGADKALWHKWQVAPNGNWSGWNSQGGWIDRIAIGRNAL